MNTTQTALAGRIFNRVVAKSQDAVFLYTPQDEPLLLSFGPNHISKADYLIRLRSSDGCDVEFSSEDAQPFVLLMDHCGSTKRVRLVLYVNGDSMPVLEYDPAQGTQMLDGEILIQAQSEDGAHYVTIYAGFGPTDGGKPTDTLLIDGSKEMFVHFRKYRSMLMSKPDKELE